MRALLVNNLYHPHLVGGAERSVQFLAEALARLGHEIHVATIGPRDSRTETNGVQVHALRWRNVYWHYQGSIPYLKFIWHLVDIRNPWAGRRFGRLLDEIRPDVVHTNNLAGLSTEVWSQAAGRGIPIVHTLRDYYLLCPSATMLRNGKPCEKMCAKCGIMSWEKLRLSGLVRAVVGNSRRILERHLTFGAFPNAQMREVVYSAYAAIDPPPARPIQQAGAPLRIGYLGQVAPHKGVVQLAAATAVLPAGKASLLVGGTGDPRYLEQVVAAGGASEIRLLGATTPDEFFPQIDVLAVPSLWEEPLPRVALEAMSWGIPVLSTDRGGTPEIIDEGRTGFVIRSDEVVANLASALSGLTPARLALMADDCRAASIRFRPEAVAASYLDIFTRALEGSDR